MFALLAAYTEIPKVKLFLINVSKKIFLTSYLYLHLIFFSQRVCHFISCILRLKTYKSADRIGRACLFLPHKSKISQVRARGNFSGAKFIASDIYGHESKLVSLLSRLGLDLALFSYGIEYQPSYLTKSCEDGRVDVR